MKKYDTAWVGTYCLEICVDLKKLPKNLVRLSLLRNYILVFVCMNEKYKSKYGGIKAVPVHSEQTGRISSPRRGQTFLFWRGQAGVGAISTRLFT
jgi:hypothetical protein